MAPALARGLVAGLLHRELGLTFKEALGAVAGIDQRELEMVQQDWAEQAGHVVFEATDRITVLDTPGPEGGLRSLHFNASVDLVQSCATLDVNGNVVAGARPPVTGSTATAVQGLSLAAAVRTARAQPTSKMMSRIAVLGAGACTLPAFLHTAFPTATIEAIEFDQEVIGLARRCFGVAELEAGGRFKLKQQCAYEWLATEGDLVRNSGQGSIDMLVVDLQDGDEVVDINKVLAPPQQILEPHVIRDLSSVLAPHGVIGINCVGPERLLDQVAVDLGASAVCTPPAESVPRDPRSNLGHTHRLLFVTPDSDRPVTADEIMQVLHRSTMPTLVDNTASWIYGWKPQ